MHHPIVALIGCPNSGKTALFNRLTGSRQKVANYAGVTVERKEGIAHTASGTAFTVLDLPGVYTLRAKSPDEIITRDVLLGRVPDVSRPSLFICVADATNLKLHLRMALEIKQLGVPMILAVNMMDIAKRRGFTINFEALSQKLGIPVIGTVAVRHGQTNELLAAIETALAAKSSTSTPPEKILDWHEPTATDLRKLSHEVRHTLDDAGITYGRPPVSTYRIDTFLLNPVLGILSLFALMFCVFQAVFTWAAWPMDQIDGILSALSAVVESQMPQGLLQSFIINGIIGGVGSVIVFLPQILILYFFILLLEDTGYMARAAFLLDKLMGGVGLHGKAFIPLLSSFACAIPGIMATRTIESKADRFTTIMIAPLMTCSARIPVYVLIIAAFIPDTPVWGLFNLQGVVMFSLYISGILFGLLVAYVMKRYTFNQSNDSFVLEMPDYKMPLLRNLALGLYERARIFLKRAGSIIFMVTIVIWIISTFPYAPAGAIEPAINYSIAGMLGQFLQPLFAPIGFSWQMVIALIPGMAAREVAVSVLGTVYAVGDASAGVDNATLASTLAASWSLASALSFLVWYIFAPQCIATLAVIKRETNSWRWMWFATFYLFALAYIGALITYNVTLSLS